MVCIADIQYLSYGGMTILAWPRSCCLLKGVDMSAFIETRTRELMAKDGLSPLAAWNQACQEAEAEAEAELDKKLDITIKEIVQETYRGSGR